MKIKSRLLATLLAVLMIVGSIPLMVAADSGLSSGGGYTAIEKPSLPERVPFDLEDLQAKLAANGGYLVSAYDFEDSSYVVGEYKASGARPALYADTANGATSTFKDNMKIYGMVSKDESGNKYYGFEYFSDVQFKEEGGKKYHSKDGGTTWIEGQDKDHYFDIGFAPSSGGGALASAKARDKVGASIVFSLDVMPGTYNGQLFCITTRHSSGQWGDAFGALNINKTSLLANGVEIAKLPEGEFTTIATLFVPGTTVAESKYYVYVNGENITPGGLQFLTDKWMTVIKDTGTDGVTPADYVPNHIRVAQNTSEGSISFDNVVAYYSDTYPYAFTPSDETGFYEEDGKVYYVVDGELATDVQIDGYIYTDATGAVCRKDRVGDFVDFSDLNKAATKKVDNVWVHDYYYGDVVDNPSTNTNEYNNAQASLEEAIAKAYSEKTGFVPHNTLMNEMILWSFDVTSTNQFQLQINRDYKTTMSEHDGVEFAFYSTNSSNTVVYPAIFSSDKPTGGWFAYTGRYLNMTGSEFKSYKTDGSSTTWDGVVDSENKWTSLITDTASGGFTLSNGFNWERPLTYIDMTVTGFNFNYPNDADGNPLGINDGSGTIYFSGIYVIDNVYFTSVSDLNSAFYTLDGETFSKYGTGWVTVGDKKLCYSPKTTELIMNGCFYDIETDAWYEAVDGIATLANGKYSLKFYNKMDEKSTVTREVYYQNGQPMDTVEINGVRYALRDDGSVIGVDAGYTAPAPYAEATYPSNAKYAYNLNDYTLGYNKSGLFATLKGGWATIIDEGEGDKAAIVNNLSFTDGLIQTGSVAAAESITNTVIEFDLKLGTNWNETLNINAQDRTTGSNNPGGNKELVFCKITPLGYVSDKDGNPITKLSETEYTRISVVINFNKDGDTLTGTTLDYYINGVLVKSDVASGYTPALFAEIDMVRFHYVQDKATNSSIYMDNFYVYFADAPATVVDSSEVTLLNGLNDEGNGMFRYYTDGLIDNKQTTGVKQISGKLYNVLDYGIATLANGEINGKWYFNGVIADGYESDNKWYDNGVLREGVVNGKLYIDGNIYSGEYEGVYYNNGILMNGLSSTNYQTATYYVDGKPAEGYVIDSAAKMAYTYGANGSWSGSYRIDYFTITIEIQVDGVAQEGQTEMVAVLTNETLKFTVKPLEGYTVEINGVATDTFNSVITATQKIVVNYVTE